MERQAFDIALEARSLGHIDEQVFDRAGADCGEHLVSVGI
jgi:hypothetical protein